MNKSYVKPMVLVTVFIVALFVFSMLTNKENIDQTTTMDDASLPVMHFVYNDMAVGELHGYAQEMDMLSMRDGLMPIGEERVLNLEIMTYGNKVDNLSYKIRSMDSERLLIEVEEADITTTQDKVACSINLPSLFEDNQEYNMEIVLTVGEKEIYYYTRIVRAMDCYTDETLDFAMLFHEYTFRDDADTFIPTFMDPATGDATNLSYVDLSCTLRQITWADFNGVKLTEPVASFKEINSSYNVITLNYVMTNVNENKEVEYYNVEESYRLRQTPSRIYVLNFERRMNQIFRNENEFLLGTTGILLGIRDNDVEYLANESGDCIAFVQEGELWCYDRVNNTISQVFSFRGAEGINSRENWNQHDIDIIRVDEAGSISFVVYGYMNRGDHEGYVGVGAYHYDGIYHTVEEEVFIPTNKSYEVLKAEMGQLIYVNEQKDLYLMLNNDVYKIDMNSFEVDKFIDSDSDACYAVSKSGRYLAWVKQEEIYSSRKIHLEDLKTGISFDITSDGKTYVLPIAFIGEDFVYGVANVGDVKADELGDVHFLMNRIEILNTSEEKQDIIKTYYPNTGMIGNVSVDENNIYVQLVEETSGRYAECGQDTIMNREAEPANNVKLRKSVTDLKQTQVVINIKEIQKDSTVKSIQPKHILIEENRMVNLEIESEGYFYVYARGEVLLATKDASAAVKCANENYGVVVDSNLRYVFKRARSTAQPAFSNLSPNEADAGTSSMARALSIMLNREGVGVSVNELLMAGQSPIQIMENTLRDTVVLELKDCTIDELLYFIDQETPVYVRTGESQAILLTGYSASHVYYYNPATNVTNGVSYEDIERMIKDGGSYCISYIK